MRTWLNQRSGTIGSSIMKRKGNPVLHRTFGWMYAITFTLTAITGAILGAHDVTGKIAKWNFGAMGFFAILPTWVGVYKAYLREFECHREWMLRSYAVCFSVAVLLRFSFLWLIPLMAERLPDDVLDPYMVCVFLSWSLPMVLVDVWLSLNNKGVDNKNVEEDDPFLL